MLARIPDFDADDRQLALELVDIFLNDAQQRDYRVLAAVDPADRLVGYLCYGPTPLTQGTYDLYWIVVDPDCAGQGVGSRLLAAMETDIRQERGRLVIIETSSEACYARTRQFYLKNGYSLAETIPDFYREGEDRVTYRKRIASSL